MPFRILIKGAGEMATGIGIRLFRAGFRKIVFAEIPRPLAVRRAVSFCEAVYDGRASVEGVSAVRAVMPEAVWETGCLPVVVDPDWELLRSLKPDVSVDATIAKRNLGTTIAEAGLVIALGPGFAAGTDAHFVVETNRGHDLGRVISSGTAEPNTGVPGAIGGFDVQRVLRAPCDGFVEIGLKIGDFVKAGDVVCRVSGTEVRAEIDGVLRGMIREGTDVRKGLKIGDVDPRGRRDYCFTVSEKARALGGSVLELIAAHYFGLKQQKPLLKKRPE